MAKRQSWPRFFAGWLKLLWRDLSRSSRRLIVVKRDRRRHRLIITLSLPSFGRTSWYWRRRWSSRPELRRSIRSLFGLILIGLSLVGVVYLSAPFRTAPTMYVAPQSHVEQVTATAGPGLKRSLPTVLTIPSLKLETKLTRLGRNADGSLATPGDPARAGWYRYSPTPGEVGPAVIVGHVDSESGPAVFYNLRKIKSGQLVEVNRQDGSRIEFAVYKVVNYSQSHFPTQTVYGNTKRPELRLITCGGPFNYLTGHYTQNTVVFAVAKL